MSKLWLASLLGLLLAGPAYGETGILLLAHGGDESWNARVLELAQQVDRTRRVEVAFGMAVRASIQAAVKRLEARGVTEIVAVPLFISSWSSIISSTEYLLGLRKEAPAALALLAKMDHGGTASGAGRPNDHDDHSALGTTPVVSTVPITRMTPALNAHAVVADILTTRAHSISQAPAQESVLIVAHGPSSKEENDRWLQNMRSLAASVQSAEPFAAVDYLTVRDDAPKPIRDEATAELRALVAKRIAEGRRVLVVPLLLSFGGIERGIVTRLEGLAFTMAPAALMPDARLAEWVLLMAQSGG